MQFYVKLIVFVVCYSCFGSAQNACVTPRKDSGICIDIRDCRPLFQILTGPSISIEDRNYLRQSQCGYHDYPYVCCPQRQQPQPQPPKPSGLTRADLPQPGQCGTHLADRIVGGERAAINEYPWMVLIAYTRKPSGGGFLCGGALINSRYVLTAAHCVTGKDLKAGGYEVSYVRLGEWDLSQAQDCDEDYCSDGVVDIRVSERIGHESYDSTTRNHEHDIAMLRLESDAPFTDFIRPICLPVFNNLEQRNFGAFDNYTVAGWGKTEYGTNSQVKLKLNVPGRTLTECNNKYAANSVHLSENQLCAGGEKGRDSCRGDSGGPLMSLENQRQNPFYYLSGIVSFGPSPCGMEGWPGVYTRVNRYIDWILANMHK